MSVALRPNETLGILMASSPAVTFGLTLATGSMGNMMKGIRQYNCESMGTCCWVRLPKEGHGIGLSRTKKCSTVLHVHLKNARLVTTCEAWPDTANRF